MISKTIGIVGLGLLGGSILKGLAGKSEVLFGDDLLERLDEIDILVLAVPMSAILQIGARLKPKQKLLVVDVGSVKEEIAARFQEWTDASVEFIATHPMAGKESSGFAHSDPLLFQDACWVITPHAKNRESSLQEVEALIRLLGAKPLRMDARAHDRRAAIISHVPYLISKALLSFAEAQDPVCLEMAGPGFRSMTRLAKDNPALREEIGMYNRENIAETLQKFLQYMELV